MRGLGGELVDEARRRASGRRASARARGAGGAGRRGRRRRSRAAPRPSTSTRSTIPAPPPNGVSSTWPPLSERVLAGVERAQLVAVRRARCATWRWPPNHSNHSGNSVKTSSCIRPPPRRAGSCPRKARSTSTTPAATSTERTASRTSGTSRSAAPRALDLQHLARRAGEHAHARGRPRRSRRPPRSPRGPRPTTRPRPARAPTPRCTQQVAARAAPRRPRGPSWPARRRIGRSSVPARRTISASPPRDAHGGAERQQRAARARHVEGAVEPVGPADSARREPARRAPAPRQSTMSTSTRRFSLTAAAFTTVRRALAVRPPRPMILP